MKELTALKFKYIAGADNAPATTANVVGMATITGALGTIALGAIAGTPVGPAGIIAGAVTAGVMTAISTTTDKPDSKNN